MASESSSLSFCISLCSTRPACICTLVSKCSVCCRTHTGQFGLGQCLHTEKRTLECSLRPRALSYPNKRHQCWGRCQHKVLCTLLGTWRLSFLRFCGLARVLQKVIQIRAIWPNILCSEYLPVSESIELVTTPLSTSIHYSDSAMAAQAS